MRSIRETSVCVVGGAGFLGSHMVDHLIYDRRCDVLVLDNLCVGRRGFVHSAAGFVHCDITHSEQHLCDLFEKHKVKYVFNYAAHPYVPDSFDRPQHVCQTNFNGAVNVINAAHSAGVTGILQVSSAEIYGEGTRHALNESRPDLTTDRIDENDTIAPHSSYGVSKAAVDSYVQVRWKEARTPCIALRQFNCVGERDILHPYVIPEIYRQLTEFQQKHQSIGFVKLGNNSSRDFMYAGDQARVAALLLEHGQFGEVYNLGSEESVKIYDLAGLMGRIMGFDDVRVEEDPARKRPWEIWSLKASNDKIRKAIPVFPHLTGLEAALRKTINYFETMERGWPW